MAQKLLDLPAYVDFDERGNLEMQFGRQALAQAIDNWLRASPATALYGSSSAGVVWRFLHKPLNDEWAEKFRKALYLGFTQGFTPSLDVRELIVIANAAERRWEIYADLYSAYYDVAAEINYEIEQ